MKYYKEKMMKYGKNKGDKMIIRCNKCNKTTDLKSSILIQAFILWELPIKCSKCGNEIYYKEEKYV